PGIDRPLVRKRDYERFIGHEAKVELLDMINGRKRFRGDISAVDDDGVIITLPDAPSGTDPNHKLSFATIGEAKLVMTDKLMDMARADQELHPIDDDETETDEYADADNDDDNLSEETKQMAVRANRLELLQIADAVALAKSIDRMVVNEAVQDAMAKAVKGRYGTAS